MEFEIETEEEEGSFEIVDGGIIVGVCWCGQEDAWCSTSDLDSNCGGLGSVDCHCGGDLCVCHNHGEVECFGCEDCEPEYDDDYDNYDEYREEY